MPYVRSILEYGSGYGFVCGEYGFLVFAHLVEVRIAARSMYLLLVSLGSSVSPSIFGCVVMGSVVLSI